MKILIGSVATKYWFDDAREPKDIDFICENSSINEGVEHYWIDEFKELYQYLDTTHTYQDSIIATPTILLSLKCSHAAWDIHWNKTMADIAFLQEKGIKHNTQLLSILYAGFEKVHGKKKAYLQKTNDDFFKDNVNRRYVHDDLHLAVSYNERPLYESIKKDLSKAAVSVGLFNQLPRESQLKLCREEIYVTALERFLIPRDFRMSKLAAYRAAAKQLVTSMSSGWFPRFIILNWLSLRDFDVDYVQKFNVAREKGLIRLCHS